MIVIIEDEVFTPPVAHLELLSVFHLGFQGRHTIQTDPVYPAPGSRLDRWLGGLGAERGEVELVLEIGLEKEERDLPSDTSLRVVNDPQVSWHSTPLRLPLPIASRFLRSPLRLLVENRRNDGAFLRAVAPKSLQKGLEDAIAKGWIEIEHGGGTDMKPRLRSVSPEEALRLWVLSDSDAREPGKPVPARLELQALCQDQGIVHHLLQRRESENYLPPKALEGWVYKGPKSTHEARRKTHQAFSRLRPEQRHHYNMKEGFRGDGPDIPALYADCVDQHPQLESGFGKDIAHLFQSPLKEEWLRKDGQHPETLAMVQSILRRL